MNYKQFAKTKIKELNLGDRKEYFWKRVEQAKTEDEALETLEEAMTLSRKIAIEEYDKHTSDIKLDDLITSLWP